ncbi:MAG: ATP-binding protein [Desulfobacula sp.]|nr:ATP-binding protein [Desulfobacula sp.]
MSMKSRYLTENIVEDLSEKMVFLGGPRQVGKTTIAKKLVSAGIKSTYYNWDRIKDRSLALKGEWAPGTRLIILDEFHKHSKWKTWIKGEYDTHKDKYKFLLTGSARLNIFRRGGDSLQGRYHYYTLHPFSLAELNKSTPHVKPLNELVFHEGSAKEEFDALFEFGGFPEPFLKQNHRFLRRWHIEKTERFFSEDIRELTLIKDFGNLALLAEILPEKTSSILSINSLAEDLQVNFRTVANWLDTFEQFYYCFRIPPFHSGKIASVRKEKKMYLWDWSSIKDDGPRLENFVACHLLKFCNYLYSYEGYDVSLSFLRDSTGREVDFLVTFNNKPWFSVEVKNKDAGISKNLYYFRDKLSIPYSYQIERKCKNERMKNGIRVMPADKFLTALI